MSTITKKLFTTIQQDKDYFLIYQLILLTVGVASIYLLINLFFYHYKGIWYLPSYLLLFLPFALALLGLTLYFQTTTPKFALITKSYLTYYFIYIAIGYLSTSVQYTPFLPIDNLLIMTDNYLGYNTIKMMGLTFAHPYFHLALILAYNSVYLQLLFLPYVLALMPSQQRALCVFFFSALVSALLGMTIYYCFPTVAPAHYFISPFFTNYEHNTYLKFYEVHHHLPIQSSQGGLIAFPSFHVIWVFLLLYAYKDFKWVFYPLLIIDLLITAATLLLGWHYLVDVVASFFLIISVTYFAERSIPYA
ncbi:MAG: hypothetical protein A3E87_10205 [Gammaproteobacteria bacterium RIFCSPHIGHO2_12_FULL_35_23]|nr:MAG: hypothetical protein A3E87_10205 [Gammaproteobacteria bacterium RIFCSPHIGHO2_12_FULL_35_23]